MKPGTYPFTVYGPELIDPEALRQMTLAMNMPVVVKGALMADAHVGYGLPIGGVVAAYNAVMHAQMDAYIGRKLRKRDMRKLWITRINAAARLNEISYSKLMGGLKKAGIDLNRKVLSDIAIEDPSGFTAIVSMARGK